MKKTELKIQENIPLAPFTTLKVGGAARYFVKVVCEDDVVRAIEFARENNLPLFILGGGSNIVVSDAGFDGLVLQISLKGISEEIKDDKAFITAMAGEDWDSFVDFCVGKNFAGIENLSGIPGFIGGTPVQNVGAYGQEVSETIQSVRVFDREQNAIVDLSNGQCGFSYRRSIFNTTEKERYIVLSVTFSLTPNGVPSLRYKDLQDYFANRVSVPALKEVRDAVIEIRSKKSMVIDERDPNSRSAGSFFKNPIVSEEEFRAVEERAKLFGVNETVLHFPASDNQVKIPAAWLIERAGFHKGFIRGAVGISANHSLAIISRGGATANDIISFKNEIKSRVYEIFGVLLLTEPVFVGFTESQD